MHFSIVPQLDCMRKKDSILGFFLHETTWLAVGLMRWLPVTIRNGTCNCYFTTVFDSMPENQSLDYQGDWKMKSFHWSEGCFLCLIQCHIGTLSFTERQASSPQLLPVPFGFMLSRFPHTPSNFHNMWNGISTDKCPTQLAHLRTAPSLQARPILLSQHLSHSVHFFIHFHLISCHINFRYRTACLNRLCTPTVAISLLDMKRLHP